MATGAQSLFGSFARSNARRYAPAGGRVTVADVAGIDEAKEELRIERKAALVAEPAITGGAPSSTPDRCKRNAWKGKCSFRTGFLRMSDTGLEPVAFRTCGFRL
jgi:hypothetical protein